MTKLICDICGKDAIGNTLSLIPNDAPDKLERMSCVAVRVEAATRTAALDLCRECLLDIIEYVVTEMRK